jgi:hypothetical protein
MSRALVCAAALAFVGAAPAARAQSAAPRVVVLDDAEKVGRALTRPLGPSPWPSGAIDLFALRGETLGLQVVVEAGAAAVDDVHVLFEPLVSPGGAALDVAPETFVERFVVIAAPTRNDHGGASLAFTERAAPASSFLGPIADALVPSRYETARAAPHERAAVWVDLRVPDAARAGTYHGRLLVRDARGELAARPVRLRVLDRTLPFAAAPVFVFYDTGELAARMGTASAEAGLRAVLHAHHVSAVHRLFAGTLDDKRTIALERAALSGVEYSSVHGYAGPGENVVEGVLALGTYGSLGQPSADARDVAEKLARAVLPESAAASTAAFIYAIDEQCDSDWPARWVHLVEGSPALRGFRVGATCKADPSAQAADLVMQTPRDLDPSRMRAAERVGKWVWAYNGMRPYGGPMMLDVPATDLRANAWIAMRYGIPRWFYWHSTFWFDDNRGGQGGEHGFDPFTVAETFHNADGDRANGDGILVYPGTQTAAGMVSYGADELFPSVRLKNVRRGVEDAGYIALAREVDRARADAIVERVIPRALAWARDRASWPDDARSWIDARRALADLLAQTPDAPGGGASDDAGGRVSDGCSVTMSSVRVKGALHGTALALLVSIALARRARRRDDLSSGTRPAVTNGKRETHDDAAPSTRPGHRLAATRVRRSLLPPPAPREEPTDDLIPPPPATVRSSGIRAKRDPLTPGSATVDLVLADLADDPRRERE